MRADGVILLYLFNLLGQFAKQLIAGIPKLLKTFGVQRRRPGCVRFSHIHYLSVKRLQFFGNEITKLFQRCHQSRPVGKGRLNFVESGGQVGFGIVAAALFDIVLGVEQHSAHGIAHSHHIHVKAVLGAA